MVSPGAIISEFVSVPTKIFLSLPQNSSIDSNVLGYPPVGFVLVTVILSVQIKHFLQPEEIVIMNNAKTNMIFIV